MHPSWVLGESEHRFSCEETVGCGPAPKWVWCVWQQILSHSLHVEIPSVWAFSLGQVALEQASPFGALNLLLQISNNWWESSVKVEILNWFDVSTNFSCSFEVVLIHGAWSDTEVTSGLVQVVAGGSKGNFSSQTMSTESGHRNLMFIHESCDIIWDKDKIYRPSLASWIQRYDQRYRSFLGRESRHFFNLGSGDKRGRYFVVGIGEEWEPVFSFIKDFRDEDKVGTVLFGGGNLDTSEFDFGTINVLWFWVIIGLYFLGDRWRWKSLKSLFWLNDSFFVFIIKYKILK